MGSVYDISIEVLDARVPIRVAVGDEARHILCTTRDAQAVPQLARFIASTVIGQLPEPRPKRGRARARRGWPGRPGGRAAGRLAQEPDRGGNRPEAGGGPAPEAPRGGGRNPAVGQCNVCC